MGRGLRLALCCAAMVIAQPLIAQTPEPAGATADAQSRVRVVVFDQLAQPEPDGLRIVGTAAAQLEREFRPAFDAMQLLAEQINQGGPNAEALKRDYDVRSNETSVQLGKRQKALFDPIIARVEASLADYAAATGGEPIFLVTAQDIAGLAPEAIDDLSASYVVWMNAQP